MIVRPRPHWVRLLFVWHGSVLPRILPQLAAVVGFSILVAGSHGHLFEWKVPLNATPFTLIGVALAIFLGFRINASYERYWEARKLWGTVLIECRTLARQALTLSTAPEGARSFVLGLVAFGESLKHQLRGSDPRGSLRRLLPPAAQAEVIAAEHRPNRLLLWLARWLAEARRGGQLDPILAATMEPPLARLTDAMTGCERIAGTPIPFTYTVIIHRTVYFYSFLLPFGLVDGIGVMTPVVVGFVAYTFFALEALSDEIEEPFGTQPNDLALDAITVTLERSLREMLGDTDLPEAPKAFDYVIT